MPVMKLHTAQLKRLILYLDKGSITRMCHYFYDKNTGLKLDTY